MVMDWLAQVMPDTDTPPWLQEDRDRVWRAIHAWHLEEGLEADVIPSGAQWPVVARIALQQGVAKQMAGHGERVKLYGEAAKRSEAPQLVAEALSAALGLSEPPMAPTVHREAP